MGIINTYAGMGVLTWAEVGKPGCATKNPWVREEFHPGLWDMVAAEETQPVRWGPSKREGLTSGYKEEVKPGQSDRSPELPQCH